MSLTSFSRFSVLFLLVFLTALAAPVFSQDQPPAPQPAPSQPEAQPATPPPADPQPAAAPAQQQPAVTPPASDQAPATPPAGEQPSTGEQDVRYTAEEYSAYQKAVETPDPDARQDAIIAFVKANPQSSLVTYAISAYEQMLQEYESKGQLQKLGSAGEKLLGVRPDDPRIGYVTGLAFYKTQQFTKAVPLLEKSYGKQPEPNIAFMLADASSNAGDQDRLIKYGEIACAQFEPKDTYRILTAMTRAYSEKRVWGKAADAAKKTLQGLTAAPKPDGVPDAEWDDYVGREKAIAYSAIGKNFFERGNMQGVLENYKKSLASYKKLPGLQAEAYYQIGRAYVKASSAHWAMVAFAKGAAIQGAPHQKPCKAAFEAIYKPDHNGSLAGSTDFIEEAQSTPLP